jgi:hypothetical protein
MKRALLLLAGMTCVALPVGFAQALKHLFADPPPNAMELAYYPSYDLLKVRINPIGPQTVVPTALLRAPDGQPGLRAEYFANDKLSGEPALVRVDAQVDFNWRNDAPDPALPADKFSVRWTGALGPLAHPAQLQATSDDGVRVWLDDALVIDGWRIQPPKTYLAKQPLEPGKTYRLRIEYFESAEGASCRLELVRPLHANAATIELRTTAGESLWRKPMEWTGPVGEAQFPTGPLADGRYVVRAVIADAGGPVEVERSFARRRFPWEGNRLGITNAVFAPFTPVRVASNTVDVVLRRHRVGGLGLWDSVEAAGNVSAGGPRELLAGPMVLRVNGGVALTGPGRFTSREEHAVVYEGEAKHPAVTARTRTTTEYDGCMKVELTLGPGAEQQPLEALWLEIPLRAEMAPLFHASTTHLRHNPAGAVPAGNGRVWGSDSNRCRWYRWHSTFNAYVWLGAEERGLAWFADNDKNWELDLKHNPPCQEIIRESDRVILRVNLVQKPVTLTEPRTIVFGLMASPAKPLRADWRTVPIGWMGAQYWGSDQDFAARYPRHGDLAPLEMVKALRLKEPFPMEEFLKSYRERNFQPHQPALRNWETMRNLLNWTANWARGGGTNVPLNAYWEEFYSVNHLHPEVDYFKAEWGGDYHWRVWGNIGGLAPSYRDFAVWWGAVFIRHGIGLYFDNAFPKANYDPITSDAYRLPTGQMQPSAGIWAHRDYLRRIWILHRTEADPRMPVLQMIHMTNTQILPYLVWNDANLDLEWKDGAEPAQWKYPADLLRAHALGRQTGNIPLALANIHSKGPEAKFAERTRAAVFAVHEIKPPSNQTHPLLAKFGYGRDDCRVFNYWDENFPLQCSDPAVKSILLRRGDEALLALCTWNPNAADLTATPDWSALGLDPAQTVVRDLESNTELALAAGMLQFSLPGYEARYLRFTPKENP